MITREEDVELMRKWTNFIRRVKSDRTGDIIKQGTELCETIKPEHGKDWEKKKFVAYQHLAAAYKKRKAGSELEALAEQIDAYEQQYDVTESERTQIQGLSRKSRVAAYLMQCKWPELETIESEKLSSLLDQGKVSRNNRSTVRNYFEALLRQAKWQDVVEFSAALVEQETIKTDPWTQVAASYYTALALSGTGRAADESEFKKCARKVKEKCGESTDSEYNFHTPRWRENIQEQLNLTSELATLQVVKKNNKQVAK